MKTFRRLRCVVVAWWSIALAAAALPGRLADLDEYVGRVLNEFEVPGLAIAIVKDGDVVLERGFGVRKLGEPARVDAHTRFAIASNTKAFTAAALAILMDEGRLKWSDRVIEHLPWFQMADPYVTREMTVRDLLVHRSGLALGAGDLLYWPTTSYTAEEIGRRLRFVPLATSFRANYAYDNILYGVAGLTIQQVSGRSWAEFVRERILVPAGMTETSALPLDARQDANVATGHAKFDFKDLRPIPDGSAFENNPAAATIHSSVHDLAKWMLVQLAGGQLPVGGGGASRPLFSTARQEEMWSVVTPMPIGKSPVAALAAVRPNFLGYGHGWVLADFRGHKLAYHTGGWPGMVSRLTLLPARKLGVVVLTNQEAGAAFNAVTMHVLDAFLGAEASDWISAYAAAVKRGADDAAASWQKHVAARDPQAKPALPLVRFAGRLRDAWYGDVVVTEEGGRLVMRFDQTPQLVGDLEHWQQETFIVRWRDRTLNADAWVTFSLTPDAKIDRVKLAAISPATDFSFDFHHLALKPVEE
ncbi:MAG: serine hydrolase [Verrucomicrobia bacterium]|nr:serine hydrolase [Verrucomicrobiota bacterium]